MKARYFAIAASALLVTACGGSAENTEAAADSAMAPAAPVEAPVVDTGMAPVTVDSAAMAPVDSAAVAAPATDTAAH